MEEKRSDNMEEIVQKWVPVISVSSLQGTAYALLKKGIRYRRRHF